MHVDQPPAPERWGGATGVGSLPGTNIAEAVKLVLGELTALPHLPELPARGPGADMIGRGGGLLADLPVELYAGRWRIASRPGRDLRRARDLLERDLDALTEAGQGYAGPLKVQAPGPWTLAASVELPAGGRLLRDHGAVRDLTASLAEGLAAHVSDVAGRIPAATVVLQVDEPSLPAVLAGRVLTESGLRTIRRIEASAAESALRSIVEAVGVPVVVHSCAADIPFDLLRTSGASAVSIDLDQLVDPRDLDALGACVDAGLGLFAGAVPALAPADDGPAPSSQVAERVRALWATLGFPLDRLPRQVVVTPACGLAGADPEYARAALGACVEAARRLHDLAGE